MKAFECIIYKYVCIYGSIPPFSCLYLGQSTPTVYYQEVKELYSLKHQTPNSYSTKIQNNNPKQKMAAAGGD